ncbi:MAG: type I-MYXAN CRISPR-associated protein Cas6/Cmx6 [Gammaproteobacteria bacterium]|nr:MAG: type I-MYXAN CRISPR-associated protein Cas6/Cmx6 [Gammaproteobacteria bacterium]
MNMPNGGHVIDLYFHLQGKQIGADHGYALYGAISRVLESAGNQWFHEANDIGLLPVRGRYVGQGKLALGRGARFGLRLPVERIPKVLPLAGKRIEINGDKFLVGTTMTSALIPTPVLYAHLVTTKNGEDETRFDEESRRQLQALDIKGTPQRGPRRIVTIKDKKVVGYSLLVTGLTADESIRLQEQGLGGRRKMGCGVFLPWKR